MRPDVRSKCARGSRIASTFLIARIIYPRVNVAPKASAGPSSTPGGSLPAPPASPLPDPQPAKRFRFSAALPLGLVVVGFLVLIPTVAVAPEPRLGVPEVALFLMAVLALVAI